MWCTYRIVGNFRVVEIFAFFCNLLLFAKISACNCLITWAVQKFNLCRWLCIITWNLWMAYYHFPLSAHISPATIRVVNKAVQKNERTSNMILPQNLRWATSQDSSLRISAWQYSNSSSIFYTSSHCFHLKRQLFSHYPSNSTRYICGRGINVIN